MFVAKNSDDVVNNCGINGLCEWRLIDHQMPLTRNCDVASWADGVRDARGGEGRGEGTSNSLMLGGLIKYSTASVAIRIEKLGQVSIREIDS